MIEGKFHDDGDVRRMLQAAVAAAGSERALARSLGVTHTYINWIINGKHPPTPAVLKVLGLQRMQRLYVPLKASAAD
jgi:transcriptional regulator with XRE-family HTH domain